MFTSAQPTPWDSIPASNQLHPPFPVRNPITRSGDHFRAKARCPRTGEEIRCESLLERSCLNLLMFALGIGRITHQPGTFTINIDDRTRQYTPDFAIVTPQGSTSYFEVKPFAIAHTRKKRRFHNAVFKHLRSRGSNFYVLTERHLERRGFADIQRLLQFRHNWFVERLGGPPIDESIDAIGLSIWHEFPCLRNAVAGGRSISIKEAVNLLGGGSDASQCLLVLLTTRHLAWPIRHALGLTTRLHQYTEADDEQLFI